MRVGDVGVVRTPVHLLRPHRVLEAVIVRQRVAMRALSVVLLARHDRPISVQALLNALYVPLSNPLRIHHLRHDGEIEIWRKRFVFLP
jgi:hypothetical protein